MTVDEILEKVQRGEMAVQDAKKQISNCQELKERKYDCDSEDEKAKSRKCADSTGYRELGYAKLDLDRKHRTGFAEVVYCSGKAEEQLYHIYERIYKEEGEVLGTRASQAQYEALKPYFDSLTFDSLSHILKIEKQNKLYIGNIVVCTAGTADIPVAEEAAQTAEFFGTKVQRIYDVGVCGIHRLLSQLEKLQSANCVVAAAGMEGALASVIGGLVSNPVIAVPTSVGYGASLNGLSALLTMVNSCANGIAVVNIDNGYGAGYMATQINRLAEGDMR